MSSIIGRYETLGIFSGSFEAKLFQCIVDCVNEKDTIQNIPQEAGSHFENITEYKAVAIVSEEEGCMRYENCKYYSIFNSLIY